MTKENPAAGEGHRPESGRGCCGAGARSPSPGAVPEGGCDGAEAVRATVSQAYARAVTGEHRCCEGLAPKGAAARTAGYREADLADLPEDAVVNSFGCGNPLAFADVQPGQTVLDLGSGAGIDLLIAAKAVGPDGRVIGVDMTDEMIERARANIAAAGVTNVEVRKGLIEALPVETGSVDWVISNCVINLSPEKHRVFAEIARVLRPGGRMQVSDVVVEELPDWARDSATLYVSCVAGAISEAEYLEEIRRAGLVDVEVVDRLLYEPSQVLAIVQEELPEVTEELLAEVGKGRIPDAESMIRSLEGKVQSIKVTARKP